MPITEIFLDAKMMEAASALSSAQKSLQDSKKVMQIHVDHASIAIIEEHLDFSLSYRGSSTCQSSFSFQVG